MKQREFKKAVNKRADMLMEEYRKKADDIDTLMGEDRQKRVRKKLDQ